MVAAGGAALAPMSQAGGKPVVRNPIMVTVLTFVCFIYGLITFYQMMSELKAYLNKEEIVPWHLFVPILGLIVLLTKLPGWVTEAKQRAGSRNPQSAGPIMYFLLAPYFFTKDMNEVADPMGTSS
jgi:NADH:ubiquinone oxidoreductase subunit 6 (subunit J)